MKVTFPAHENFRYVEVFEVVEKRDSCVFTTKRLGFAQRERQKSENEIYAPLSTALTRHVKEVTLELMD